MASTFAGGPALAEPLSDDDKRQLLRIARRAVEVAVNRLAGEPPALEQLLPALARPGACFVTIYARGELRGCIGGLEAREPLALNVYKHAAQTALSDFRFPAIKPAELDNLDIEISVLTEPQPLAYRDPTDLLELLRPGIDGAILKKGFRRATFLPQVWEKVPDATTFLNLLCRKLYVPDDEWRRGTLDVYVYQAEKLTEHDFGRG